MAAKLTFNTNGPIKVEGDFELVDASGKAFDPGNKKSVFLCRCGTTKNAPLCDGSHKSCGFVDETPAREL